MQEKIQFSRDKSGQIDGAGRNSIKQHSKIRHIQAVVKQRVEAGFFCQTIQGFFFPDEDKLHIGKNHDCHNLSFTPLKNSHCLLPFLPFSNFALSYHVLANGATGQKRFFRYMMQTLSIFLTGSRCNRHPLPQEAPKWTSSTKSRQFLWRKST